MYATYSANQKIIIGGTGLTAPVLTRTSATATTYPLTFDFSRPNDWDQANTVTGVVQRSQDITFTTGVTETTATITGATTSYNFGISAIVSGVWYVRMAAYAGSSRPTNLNWSLTLGVGTATAPTMTSSASISGNQFIAGTYTLTASLPSTFAITGGTNQDQASISGSTLTVDGQSATGTLDIRITPTSVFQVAGTEQSITDTIAANTPSAFTFTDITNASLATVYTSNTITIAGITTGSVPVSITGGTYSKNGGAYTSAAGTAVNGDTFTVRQTSSASNNATTNTVLTVGATSDTYSVSTPVVLSTTTAWNTSDKSANVTISGADSLTATGANTGAFKGARGTTSKNSGKLYFEGKSTAANSGTNTGIGIADATASFATNIGTDAHGSIYFSSGFVSGNGNPASYTAIAVNDVCMVAIDFTAKKLWYGLNGTWNGNPAAGTGGIDISFFTGPAYNAFSDQSGGGFTLNTGHSTFAYSPPSGFVAWDV